MKPPDHVRVATIRSLGAPWSRVGVSHHYPTESTGGQLGLAANG